MGHNMEADYYAHFFTVDCAEFSRFNDTHSLIATLLALRLPSTLLSNFAINS